jgi:hypothetical protein
MLYAPPTFKAIYIIYTYTIIYTWLISSQHVNVYVVRIYKDVHVNLAAHATYMNDHE